MGRSIDKLGRIVIPWEIRKEFRPDDQFEVTFCAERECILLTCVSELRCSCCRGHKPNLQQVGELLLCDDCIEAIQNL